MKTLLLAAVSIASLLLCSTSHAITYNLSGSMDRLQAGTNGGFGAGTGNGSGTIAGDYDDVTNLLNYSISWQDLTAAVSNIHFHLGAVGVSGGVALGVPSPWISPEIGSNIALDIPQETGLLAGNWYVNVHTTAFTGGEIRGQVLVTAIPEPATAAMATLAFLSTLSLIRRRR